MDTTPLETEKDAASGLDALERKTKLTGKVIKISLAGALVDIGMDTPGVVHISQLQTEPVNKVEDVVQVGQTVDVWIRRVVPNKNRIELTMIKPLEVEWRDIEPDMVFKGKVTRLESFGAFVDIGAERPGLVHISELAHGYVKDPTDVVHEGDEVEVKVLKVSRRKRQIKLSMKALQEAPIREEKPKREPRQTSRKPAPKVEIDDEPQEVVPTAMEMALREAMERSKQKDDSDELTRRKPAGRKQDNNLEAILNRTLENKVRSR